MTETPPVTDTAVDPLSAAATTPPIASDVPSTASIPDITLAPEAASEPLFRMEAKNYIDQSGRQVTEMSCVKGIAPRDVVRFILRGEIKIKTKQPGPNGGPSQDVVRPIPVQIAVQADDLDHAFALYDATLRDYGERQVAAMKEQHMRASLAGGSGLALPPGAKSG
jgi:hypothetical protein